MIPFYGAADNAIYNQGYSFIPQEQYRGAFTPRTIGSDDSSDSGITTLPSKTTGSSSGAGITSVGGNAFGYGSAINPVSYGQYGAPGYMGGLPGGVQQFGVGRQFEDPSASPIGETYSYEKQFPGFIRAGAAFIPGGNFLLNLAEKRMNANRDQPSGNYAVGGLNDFQKGAYNQLAGQGMLFSGSSGLKTATGKNFGAKGYFEGQADIFNDLTDKGFSLNDDDDVVDGFGNVITGFRALQYKEALANQNYQNYQNQKEAQNIQNELAAAAAAKSKALALAAIKKQGKADYNPNIHGPTNYGKGADGNQSFGGGNQGFGSNATSGGPVSNRTGRGRTDYIDGGLASIL